MPVDRRRTTLMNDALSRISHSIWELRNKVKEHPADIELRKDLLKFFCQSRWMIEMRRGVPEEDRSFVLLQERESICCFLIHGSGGSPAEMRTLGEHLFEMGYSVYAMNLPLDRTDSHGSMLDVLKRVFNNKAEFGVGRGKGSYSGNTWTACVSEAEITLEVLFTYTPNVYVVGFSFGGTMALDLVNRHSVKAAVLISPALVPVPNGRFLFFHILRKILPSAARAIRPRDFTVLEFMNRTKTGLTGIKQPVLLIQASRDPMISLKGFNLIKSHLENRRSKTVMLENDDHVLVSGDNSEEIFRLCGDFIKEV